MTFTLTISNNGPTEATHIVLTDTLPGTVQFTASQPGSPTCTKSALPAEQLVCALASIPSGSSARVVINANVNQDAAGQVINHAVVTSDIQDPDTSNNDVQSITKVDREKPLVSWVSPTIDGEGFLIDQKYVHLVVTASDNLAVGKVRFFRWDKYNFRSIDIGKLTAAPFIWDLNTWSIFCGWNEIDVMAYDTAGNPSEQKYIFLYRTCPYYMPLVIR